MAKITNSIIDHLMPQSYYQRNPDPICRVHHFLVSKAPKTTTTVTSTAVLESRIDDVRNNFANGSPFVFLNFVPHKPSRSYYYYTNFFHISSSLTKFSNFTCPLRSPFSCNSSASVFTISTFKSLPHLSAKRDRERELC